MSGIAYPPGPIRLSDFQVRLADEILATDERGMFKYTTVVLSMIKKSGKTTLTSGLGLLLGHRIPYAHIYCLANDGKGATDRLYAPIYTCIKLHQKLGGIFHDVRPGQTSVMLENGSKIESIPCDATGEAGAEPTAVLFSEFWGYYTEEKRRLFAELTIPPTRFGRAIRIVESYAGQTGLSDLLWGLYEQGVKFGEPHPDFLDITTGGDPVVWVNKESSMLCIWDHERRMAWQLGADGDKYYQQEAKILAPSEFARLHRNEWVSPTGAYAQPSWWDTCGKGLPKLNDNKTPVVVALDAAETNDCAAIVAVTRDPDNPDTECAIRASRIFKPERGVILLEETLGRTLQDWCLRGWNIVCVAYDNYQLAKMVQDYRRGHVLLPLSDRGDMSDEQWAEHIQRVSKAVQRWYYKFGQQSPRAVADKMLYDMIVHNQIHWDPQDQDWDIAPRGEAETITKHIKQAGVKQDKGQYRLAKLANSMHIDGAVALSMAVERCMTLALDNREKRALPGLPSAPTPDIERFPVYFGR